MEGPQYPPGQGPSSRPPAAGDRTGVGQDGLRDWQKETWFGAVPVQENPFDEPENAPELRDLRSEELNNHSGSFWDQHTGGYSFSERTPRKTDAPVQKKKGTKETERVQPLRHPMVYVAVGLVLTALICLIFYFGFFTVREILVEGNTTIPDEEIIKNSGIQMGTPIFALKAENIARGIENNVYLRFRYLDKELPGTVVLTVKEREACCWMTYCGIFYTMDKQRTVLSETESQEERTDHLVRVDGLRIRSGCMVGQTLALETDEQQNLFTELFLEMKIVDCTDKVEEVDLSNAASLLLTTRAGFTVSLGDSRDLHAKLKSMKLTQDELIHRGYVSGVINVSDPANPVFSPQE